MFVVGHPEKLIDFAYRAVHEMTVAAKAITAGYDGAGSEAFVFQRLLHRRAPGDRGGAEFPGDYDGIISGDPDVYATHIQAAQLFIGQAAHKDDGSYIPPAKYPALHGAALAACDALDGVKDGVIEDPTRCKFDPKVLECKGADAPTCLTAPQVESAEKTYAGSHAGKSALWGLEPGSESGWASLSGPQPLGLAVDTYQYLVFNNPKWDYHTLDPAKDVAAADKAVGAIMNSAESGPEAVFLARRKVDYVSRLGRSWHSTDVQRRVFQERRGEGWRNEEGRGIDSPVHGSWHGALRRRRRPKHVQLDGRAGNVGGAGEGSGADDRFARDTRPGRSHPASVPLSADRRL